jgi:hypothetical protein
VFAKSPDAADGVGVEGRIDAEKRHVLDDGLGNYQTVEGIAVVEGEGDGPVSVLGGDCQNGPGEIGQTLGDSIEKWQ